MVRKITQNDRQLFIELAEDFYNSPAVLEPVPLKNHTDTFDEMIRSDCYLDGYIFEHEKKSAGYGLIAKTYSQEAGGIVLWIEEIYIRPEFRSMGLGRELFEQIENNRSKNIKRIRLEVEPENKRAVSLYKRLGYENLDYNQMFKDFD